jgi:polyisoprenyl-phosphate glycosyltransferase
VAQQAAVVYAQPTNKPSHGPVRNLASRGAKAVVTMLTGGTNATLYQSYRLVLGEIGRSVAAYSGPGVYLDVALGWVAGKVATAPVLLRDEGDRTSGYSLRTLVSHFWRMVLSSGTRALRAASVLGVVFALGGIAFAIFLGINRLAGNEVEQGWTSTMVVVLLSTGVVLFSLGIVAEYLGVAVSMAVGKPPYLIVSDPAAGPLGRSPRRR